MEILQLWAWIVDDSVLDTRIIDPLKYPIKASGQYIMIAEHEDRDFLESMESHLKRGAITYRGFSGVGK